MNSLKDYVEWNIAQGFKTNEEYGYPLVLKNCRMNKEMKEFKIYGNSFQNEVPSLNRPSEVYSVGEKTINLYNHSLASVLSQWNASINKAVFNAGSVTSYVTSNVTGGFLLVKIGNVSVYRGKTISCTWKPKAGNINISSTALCIYDANNNRVKESSPKALDNGYFHNILSVPETVTDTDNLAFRLYFGDSKKDDAVSISEVMLYEGAEPLPYEPYGKYKIPVVMHNDSGESEIINVFLSEPLRRFGDYADYIDFKNKKVIRHMYEEVFNGTEVWTQINVVAGAAGFRFDMKRYGGGPMASVSVYDNAMCNKYPIVRARSDKTCSGAASGGIIVDFIDSSFNDSNEWNAYLASEYAKGTPLKFLHTLATPNEEQIDCDLPVITGENVTFEVDSTVAPSNMYGKYIKM